MSETQSADAVLSPETFRRLTAHDPHGVHAAAWRALQWFDRRASGSVPNSPEADVFIARALRTALESVGASVQIVRCVGATAGRDAGSGGCGWIGDARDLNAEACPRCDGRVTDAV